MHVESQITSLTLALVGFGLAALPRFETRERRPVRPPLEWPIGRLLRFPVFWAGLALLSYIAIQAFNPAWRFAADAESWWLEPVAATPWLPSSIAAPFERSNPWRAFLVFASLWLVVCSIWAGFLRRRSYHLLFTTLAANAFVLSLLSILQKLNGTDRIFWAYLPSNPAFVGSFIYPNHAGPYFNLMLALTLGLAWWHYRRAHRELETRGVARALTLFVIFIGTVVFFSYSRTSIVLLLIFAALVGGILIVRHFRAKEPNRDHEEFLPLLLFLAGFLGVALVSLKSEKLWERFNEISTTPLGIARDRAVVRHAAGEMLRDHWLFGWGAGSFRYGFPLYARNYPEIYLGGTSGRKYWEHAHDDLLEFPIELGAVGMIPLVVTFAFAAWELVRRRFWRNPVSFCAVLACALVLLHGGVDFVFQNPAVLFLWSVLFLGSARWAELDGPATNSAASRTHANN